MGHRDTLLCDTTYLNVTIARSSARECVRRSKSGFVQVGIAELLRIRMAYTTVTNYSRMTVQTENFDSQFN
jgi:hypothetical protein